MAARPSSPSSSPQHPPAACTSRRSLLAGLALSAGLLLPLTGPAPAPAALEAAAGSVEETVRMAAEAWEQGTNPLNPRREADLARAIRLWDAVVATDPQRGDWLQARAELLLDAKLFPAAVAGFTQALALDPGNPGALAGRALAEEGLGAWPAAVADYTAALAALEKELGGRRSTEALYVRNSRGNALASEGRYADALQDYAAAAQGFQQQLRAGGRRQLDGAVCAAANAALTRVQLGQEERGERELAAVARRAPASVDVRAALAAVHWAQGRRELAEEEWGFACEQINSVGLFDGCGLYKDRDWLTRIRRWPPVMVQRMDDFLHLR